MVHKKQQAAKSITIPTIELTSSMLMGSPTVSRDSNEAPSEHKAQVAEIITKRVDLWKQYKIVTSLGEGLDT